MIISSLCYVLPLIFATTWRLYSLRIGQNPYSITSDGSGQLFLKMCARYWPAVVPFWVVISTNVNPNVAYLHRQKALNSRDSTPSAAVLGSDRTSRTVKYASTCPNLCAATSDALLRVFPRRRYATLGLTVREILLKVSKDADGVLWCKLSGFGR